ITDALLGKLAQLSSFPQSLALATTNPKGGWSVASKTTGYVPRIEINSPALLGTPNSVIATEERDDHLAMMARLATAQASRPVIAILDYPLEEALSAYRAVITPMLLVLAI